MATKKERTAQAVAQAVGAGRPVALETVDFSDPNRPKTCLEVDFPILPVNQVAIIEGNAGKPIYQMSKWWARRRSSVFRSLLIAAATKAPDDPTEAAKRVWEAYYANHQTKGAFKHLKVADIFMGGGTTLVEGSRLGMQMIGNELNPVAWFVVKQEFAKVDLDEVKRLLADIEAEVRPQIMPFYACDGPDGERGTWTHLPSGRIEGPAFDPLTLTPAQRREYRYVGPEIIYTFWAKHGPCQVTGCGHRTPIMTSPVMAVKTISVKHWEHRCGQCGTGFDVEEKAARMAPEAPLVVAPGEAAYSILDLKRGVVCPACGHAEMVQLGKGQNKKVSLTLLVHPEWLAGAPSADDEGQAFGGSAQDDAESTARWDQARAARMRLLEVRGELPAEVTCPETGVTFQTSKNEAFGMGKFVCAACGTRQEMVSSLAKTEKAAPLAAYAIQGYSASRNKAGAAYGGRFFAAFDPTLSLQFDAAVSEWETLKDQALADYWPRSDIPDGLRPTVKDVIKPGHWHTNWVTMFNSRQLLVHAQLLKAVTTVGDYDWAVRECVLGAFQQYLRNQSLFSFWDISRDCLAPFLSNSNFQPKNHVVENCVLANLGRGNWKSCADGILEGRDWAVQPWDPVNAAWLKRTNPAVADEISGKSEKVYPGDPVGSAELTCGSSTDLAHLPDASLDLVITDPPFGGILQYAELSDFFYVWLRLVLQSRYPDLFTSEYTPKAVEVVANPYRQPEDSDGFYQRLLTQCWREAHRILKLGGLLAFTFHHSEDAPWVSVLESLFDAGFALIATYPIRSDETKGDKAEFGAQKIEYDIIHVCRKRQDAPKRISWAKLRRQVLADVRALQDLLEHHQNEGLPEADVQVIRRGKALEYFSRHYGEVYKDPDTPMTVLEALLGINQLLDEEAGGVKEAPPHNAEPFTRMLLRLYDGVRELPRDQVQKFLRGTGSAPSDFADRGWVYEEKKVFYLIPPLDLARSWVGKHRRGMQSDYDQAMFLIGACFEGSAINASETLNNEHFKPHPALGAILTWFRTHGADSAVRNAAIMASTLYHTWESRNQAKVRQLSLFDALGEE